MSDTINRLMSKGDFLHLSRTQAELFKVPIAFQLHNKINVSIPAPGIVQFEPENYGIKDVVYSCGVHGNETAPIEICDELVKNILTGEYLIQHRLLVIFGNLPAMDIGQRFVVENMNRLFDGEHANPDVAVNDERIRAGVLEREVKQFFESVASYDSNKGNGRERYHYDLHTAIRDSKNEKFAVYPFTHGKPRKPEQLEFMRSCGVSTILLSESPTTTFSYFSSKNFGADAFTVELGKVRPFGENDMSRFHQAQKTLTKLVMQKELQLPEFQESEFFIYRVNQIINKTHDSFTLHFAEDTPNFTDYEQGTVLATEDGAEYQCQQDGEAIVFPNANVALGQRALLTVIPTSLS